MSARRTVIGAHASAILRHLIGDDGLSAVKDWKNLTSFCVFQSVLSIVSDICTVAGTPWAKFSMWVLLVCFILALAFGILSFLVSDASRDRFRILSILLLGSTLFLGTLCFAQQKFSKGGSLIASESEDVRRSQLDLLENIGLVKKDLQIIETTANQTNEEVGGINSTLSAIDRPRLSVGDTFNVTKFDQNNGVNDLDFQVNIKNTGMLPSQEMHFEGEELIIPKVAGESQLNLVVAKDYCSGNAANNTPEITIQPGETMGFDLDKAELIPDDDGTTFQIKVVDNFGEQWIGMFMDGSAYLIMDGTACYKDDSNIVHYTTFCRYFDNYADFIRLVAKICTYNNDSD